MIAITGATGKLGRHVVEQLLQKIPAKDVAALVRDPAKAADLEKKGVAVRRADYDAPATLSAALKGVDTLLLISGSEVGKRLAQHRAVVEAAKSAGVKRIVYTSLAGADTARISLAPEHKGTEELIRASGIPYVFLRNSWYFENYTENLAGPLAQGAFFGAAGEGRISGATRADYAAAAVAVLTTPGHDGRIYELGGDSAFTMADLAAEVSRQTGKELPYRNLPAQEFETALKGAGLPSPLAAFLADADVAITRGELEVRSGDLRRLIGRPTTTLKDAVSAALKR